MLDVDGNIQSLQTIDSDGKKLFMQGGKAGGGMYSIGGLGDRIALAEGFATAISIHEATGLGAVVALNAGNLPAVAEAIRARHPKAQICIAADDWILPRPNQGARGRTGRWRRGRGARHQRRLQRRFVDQGAAAVAALFAVEREPESEVQGEFRVQADGIYYKKDRITSRVDVLGICRDGDNKGWGRYLAVHDPDGGVHYVVMHSAAMIGDNGECIKILVDHGMSAPIGRPARDLVVQYLCQWQTSARVRSVSRIGWHGSAFVMPDRAYGSQAETVVLQTTRSIKFKIAGTFDGWRNEVAALAVGNARIAFAMAASFVGPLLHLVDAESGRVPFQGAILYRQNIRPARRSFGVGLPAG